MQIGTKIQRSWHALAGQLSRIGPGDPSFLYALRDWLRNDLGTISIKVAEALPKAEGIELVLEGAPESLPISITAAQEFQGALEKSDPPKDPGDFVAFVNRLCRRLAVFTREDDCCPECEGNLELWTDGTRYLDVCDAQDHCFESVGPLRTWLIPQRPTERKQLDGIPAGLRPASRQQVLSHFPKARLVSLRDA